MKNNLLKKLTQDIFVIPLPTSAIEELETFCEKQIDDMTVQQFQSLILCAVLKQSDEELHQQLGEFASDKEVLKEIPLHVLEPAIAECIVLEYITNEKDTLLKAVYSLMLKNAMLLVIKGGEAIAYPQAVMDIYDTYDQFIQQERTFKSDGACDFINDYFDNHFGRDSYTTSAKDKLQELRCIVYDAACFRYDKLKKSLRQTSKTGNVFVDVYHLVKKLVNETPWLFVEQEAAKTIWDLTENLYNESKKSLNEVASDIQKVDENIAKQEYNKSSVILNVISGYETIYQDANPRQIELTPIEFAIYLYYELLVEKMLKKYIREGESDE